MPKTIEAEATDRALRESASSGVVERQAQNVAPAAPVAAQGQSGMLTMIERVLVDPEIDVSKLEKLLEMQERILDREAEQAFNRAMVVARGEMRPVARDAPNPQTKSMYSRLETIIEAIEPIYTRRGFMMSFGTDNSPLENHQRIVCDVSHADGHTRRYHDDVPIDAAGIKGQVNKTPTHAHASTLTYGRRNLTVLIWNIALKNGDDDGNAAGAGETITEEQVKWLRVAIDDANADEKKFCQFMGIKELSEMLLRDYGKAKQALAEHKAAEAKRAKEGAAS